MTIETEKDVTKQKEKLNNQKQGKLSMWVYAYVSLRTNTTFKHQYFY